MKRIRIAVVGAMICANTIGPAFSEIPRAPGELTQQHTQSVLFFGPTTWNPGSTVNVDVYLAFNGYNSFGLSYWLEVPNELAPFLSVTGATYFTFVDPNSTSPNPAFFNSTAGSSPGYMLTTRDFGATVNDPTMQMIPPGSYHITTLTFTVAAGMCNLSGQNFTMQSTFHNPRISEVTDTDFNDNNIIPPGTFSITIGSPSCTIVSQVSRKTHGAAGTFDVDLPLTGTPGIECRSGGSSNDHKIVVAFSGNVTVNGNPQAAVTVGAGTVGSDGTSNGGVVFVSGNTVTIPLTNVDNAQTINVTLYDVNYGGGNMNLVIPMSVLLADTTANGIVNSSDVAQTKSQVGHTVTASNFREDVTAGGSINGTDVAVVKANLHTALP